MLTKEQGIDLLDYLKGKGLVFDIDQSLRSTDTSEKFWSLFDRVSSLSMKAALKVPKKDLLKQINGSPWHQAISRWRLERE